MFQYVIYYLCLSFDQCLFSFFPLTDHPNQTRSIRLQSSVHYLWLAHDVGVQAAPVLMSNERTGSQLSIQQQLKFCVKFYPFNGTGIVFEICQDGGEKFRWWRWVLHRNWLTSNTVHFLVWRKTSNYHSNCGYGSTHGMSVECLSDEKHNE